MQSLISVIIPVYNTMDYIERCLESVLNNTYRNLEVICVDDGSTDDSLKLLKKMAEADPRIICISQRNAGPAAARNRGLDAATGEFVAFVDSDDWVSLRYFEKMMQSANTQDADIVVSEFEKVYGNETYEDRLAQTTEVIKTTTAVQLLRETRFMSLWGKLFRHTLLEKVRFQGNLVLGEDAVFNLNVYCGKVNMKICTTNAAIYYYYQRSTSLVHSYPVRESIHYAAEYIRITDDLADAEIKNEILICAMKSLLAARYSSMFDLDAKYFQKTCNEHLWECMRKMKENQATPHRVVMECALLTAIPLLYRAFRIATDTTMIKWEKNQRKMKKSRNVKG